MGYDNIRGILLAALHGINASDRLPCLFLTFLLLFDLRGAGLLYFYLFIIHLGVHFHSINPFIDPLDRVTITIPANRVIILLVIQFISVLGFLSDNDVCCRILRYNVLLSNMFASISAMY